MAVNDDKKKASKYPYRINDKQIFNVDFSSVLGYVRLFNKALSYGVY